MQSVRVLVRGEAYEAHYRVNEGVVDLRYRDLTASAPLRRYQAEELAQLLLLRLVAAQPAGADGHAVPPAAPEGEPERPRRNP